MEKEFGDHYLVDFHGCDAEVIASEEPTRRALLTAARDCGATIIEDNFHQFSPQGVSGVILIAESHISIHTWPEHGFAAIDIFSCKPIEISKVKSYLLEQLKAKDVITSSMKRGRLPVPSLK